MPGWGGRWSPSSLINTLGCSTRMQVGRQSVSQFLSQSIGPSGTQSVSQSGSVHNPNHNTIHGATPYVSPSPSVALSQLSSCHGFGREDAYVNCHIFLSSSRSLYLSPLSLFGARHTSIQPYRPPILPSTYPFFLQHPSNIYDDFGAAWSRLLELYILLQKPSCC